MQESLVAPWQDPAYVKRYQRVYAWGLEEIRRFLAPLELGPEDCLADFGCGAGEVVAAAAPRVRAAVGVDLSGPQLEKARAAARGLGNARLLEAGFLDWELPAASITKACSRKALHHLPDPDKLRFFERLARGMAPGGLFLLEDGMLSFELADLPARWSAILEEEAPAYYGSRWEKVKPDFIKSFAREFPTGAPALRRMLEQAGFELLEQRAFASFYGQVLARR